MNINDYIDVRIDFSDLEEIYSHSPNDLILIIKKIQDEFSKYEVQFGQYIQAENWEEFRKLRHKITATLHLLKLFSFVEYLTYLKERFENDFSDKEVAIVNIERTFRSIQELLIQKLIQLTN